MKKLVCIALVLLMLLSAAGCAANQAPEAVTTVPAEVETEEAQVAVLSVGDTFVVREGKVLQDTGDGWSYDAAENVLTLEGAVITACLENASGISALYCGGDLNLVLKGENSVDNSGKTTTVSASGICATGSMHISGDGSLTVTSGDAGTDSAGIYALSGLTVSGCTITASGGSAVRSFAIAGRDGISIENGAQVNAWGGEGKVLSTGLFSGQGDIWISDSVVNAQGGAASLEEALAENADYAQSSGISAQGAVSLSASDVQAQGGAASAGDDLHAFSNGIYTASGLNVDFESKLTAAGGKAAGTYAFSRGACGDQGGAVQVYSGQALFQGGEAVGVKEAGSFGVQTFQCGLYLYESGANVTLTGGTAAAEEGCAYSNGFRTEEGDLGIDAGCAVFSGGSWTGVSGDGCGAYVNALVEEDAASGGYVSVSSGAAVEFLSETGHAVWARMDISLDDDSMLLPEGGSIVILEGESFVPEGCYVADASGNPALHVKTEPAA